MCGNSCFVAPLRSYEARSSLVGCYLFVFIDEVSTFFVYTDDCGLCCKSSTESFRIILFWRNIEMADFDVLERFSLDCRKTKTKVNTLANQRA